MIRETAIPDKVIAKPDISIIQDEALGLFQKILLTTDGTVTDLLSLYTNEKIKVKKILQEFCLSSDSESGLCPLETPILKRNIILCGPKMNYVYAESIFIFENLTRSTQYKLLETDQPIGLMWKEEKLDTFREIIEYRIESGATLAHYFDIKPHTSLLSRTYLVYNQRNIVGRITEKFPSTYFKEASL
jgi:chorismate-pyruvate lyase